MSDSFGTFLPARYLNRVDRADRAWLVCCYLSPGLVHAGYQYATRLEICVNSSNARSEKRRACPVISRLLRRGRYSAIRVITCSSSHSPGHVPQDTIQGYYQALALPRLLPTERTLYICPGETGAGLSSPRSHARAISQSRFTVLRFTPSAWAVSASVNPPKNRMLTTCAARELIVSRR